METHAWINQHHRIPNLYCQLVCFIPHLQKQQKLVFKSFWIVPEPEERNQAMFRLDIEYSVSLLFCLIPLLCFFLLSFKSSISDLFFSSTKNNSSKLPKAYPLIGSYFAIKANKLQRAHWTHEIVNSLPNLTFTLRRPLGHNQVYTANPANVQHILKTHFDNYQKGEFAHVSNRDFLDDGIFNVNGEKWKFQRQVSSQEFNTKSFRRFVETVVEAELSQRLIPILSAAAANKTVLDFQDIFQRFAFDNICKIAFGYDPAYLLPSLPEAEFPVAFEDATRLISERLNSPLPLIWKIKRVFNIGWEKQLKEAVAVVHEFAKEVAREKKQEIEKSSSVGSVDILSRFLTSGYYDEDFVTDVVISFILAGRDTTSAPSPEFGRREGEREDGEKERKEEGEKEKKKKERKKKENKFFELKLKN